MILGGGGQVELAEDARDVLLDGSLGDDQPLGDRLVRAPFGHQLEYLALTRGQPRDRVVASPPADELRDDRRVQRRASVGHAADRARELVDVGDTVLQQVPDSLGVVREQLHRVVRLDVLGQDEDADLRMLLANRLRRGEALVGVARGHPDVDDRHVGVVAANLEQQVVRGRRLADDLEAGLLEDARDPLPQQHGVFGDDDAEVAVAAHSQRLVIRSAEISSFGTKPRAPLSRSSGPKSDSSRVDVSTIAGLRPPAEICAATSMPSMSGSWTSRSTMSGSSSRETESAPRPSEASPRTSNPSDSSSLRAIPRKRGSSSTITMLAMPGWSQTPPATAVRISTLFSTRKEAPVRRLSPRTDCAIGLFHPLLTRSRTFARAASFLPGPGFDEITRPRVEPEDTLVTLPTEQCACASARLAARSVLPFSLGTTQVPLNIAVTERAALIDTTQARVPLHAPDQPANFEPADGRAVSLTEVPCGKACAHAARQLMPAGYKVTEPVPLPAFLSFRTLSLSNVAVTAWSEPISATHEPLPAQPPDQPVNVDPAAAVAVSVTVPEAGAEHVEPQLISPAPDTTVPDPLPALVTVSVLPMKRTSANVLLPPTPLVPATISLPSG